MNELIPPALDGERVDRLVALLTDISRSAASVVVAGGGVMLDGEVVILGRTKVKAGQTIEIDLASLPVDQGPQADPSVEFEVLMSDDHVIVVDKPPGLVVHPAPGSPDRTLVNGLLARFGEIASVGDPQRPGIVHRLDAGSSGVLVVARTPEAYEALVAQFADRSASRRYLALVWGHLAAPVGIIDAPIGRDRRDPLKMAVVADGREARTGYVQRETFGSPAELSLLECSLETGRTHQIRVHLESIGHPLVGDRQYGAGRPDLGLSRPFLHAYELTFAHPITGEPVTVCSPLPEDLSSLLSELSA